MKALVIGATGAVGLDLLRGLLEDKSFSSINIFVRRSSGIKHSRLREHIVDFDNIAGFSEELKGDVLFSCMGTTLKRAGSKKAQWKVDYDYQYNVARAAAENNVPAYVLVSSIGADKDSSFFYLSMKGKLDEAIKELPFRHTTIFRPSSLIRKHSKRLMEKPSIFLLQALNAVGLFRKYRPIKTAAVASAMINAAKDSREGLEIITGEEIFSRRG